MGGYWVESDGLRECAATSADVLAQCRSAVATIRAEAVELFGAAWQGAASTAFRAGWEQWLSGVTTMLDSLEKMVVAIDSSARGYATTDEGVRTSLMRASS